MERGEFESVTKDAPCCVCHRATWCARIARYHVCMRVESDKPCASGSGWLHPRGAECSDTPIPARRKRVPDAELAALWQPFTEDAYSLGHSHLPELARELGVSVLSLQRLRAGRAVVRDETCWTFPEKNPAGLIVGVQRRCPGTGKKLMVKGSRRGLTYAAWSAGPEVIYIVEGASDWCAAYTLGLCAIGRPSNTGGLDMLAKFLVGYPHARIVVVGERDRKPQEHVLKTRPDHSQHCGGCAACWPGRWGMKETAKTLAKRLKRGVESRMPPAPHKDLRGWLNAQGIDPENADACRELGMKWRRVTRT